jgi:predicted negative regulator of RcsB-dependent stress response
MTGVGVGEIIWLALTVVLGLGVVITWIVIAESNRKFFKAEIKKLKAQLETVEQEKARMIEEIQAFSGGADWAPGKQNAADAGNNDQMIAHMMERTDELETENAKLKTELNEARSSLEEVYKAMCGK